MHRLQPRQRPSVDDMVLTGLGADAGSGSARPSSPATNIAINLATVHLSSSSGASSPSTSSWSTQPLSPPMSPNNVVTASELAAQLASGVPPVLILDLRPQWAHDQHAIRGSHAVNVGALYSQRGRRPLSPLVTTTADDSIQGGMALHTIFCTPDGSTAFQNRAGHAIILVDDRGPHHAATGLAGSAADAAQMLYGELAEDKLAAGVFILAEGFETFARTFPGWCTVRVVQNRSADFMPTIHIHDEDDNGGNGPPGRFTPDEHSRLPSRPQALSTLKVHSRGSRAGGLADNDIEVDDDDLRSASLDSLVLPMTATNHLSPASAPRPASSASSRLQQRYGRRLPGLVPLAVPAITDLKPVRAEPPSYRFLQPSSVLPWLWMGGDADAADLAKLRQLRIKYIVNMARECRNHHEGLNEFVYKHVAADDQIESPEEFEHEVSEACRFIARARQTNDGNVFVHCRAGISRSATVVIAYLVQEEHWALRDAIDHVRSVRPAVAPNLGFLVILMSIERRVRGSNSLSTTDPTRPASAAAPADSYPAEPDGGGGGGGGEAMSIVVNHPSIDVSSSSANGAERRSPRGGSYPDSPKAANATQQAMVRSP